MRVMRWKSLLGRKVSPFVYQLKREVSLNLDSLAAGEYELGEGVKVNETVNPFLWLCKGVPAVPAV